MSLPLLFSASSLAAALCLTACASAGAPLLSRGEGASEASSGGIQTRAIGSAPATREAQNDSLPLSELNTPEAIAAREAAERSETATTPKPATSAPVIARPAAPAAKPAAATTGAAPTAAAAAAKPTLPAKGSKVRLRAGSALYSRPSTSSEKGAALTASEVELGTQMYNANGYWWYVQSGAESGWLLQTDIQR